METAARQVFSRLLNAVSMTSMATLSWFTRSQNAGLRSGVARVDPTSGPGCKRIQQRERWNGGQDFNIFIQQLNSLPRLYFGES